MGIRALGAAAALALVLMSGRAWAGSLFTYNVVTSGNLTTVGGDVYGTTATGGNLAASNAALFGKSVPGTGVKVSVGGNVTGGGQIQLVGGGTLLYQGTLTGGSPSFGTATQGSVGLSSIFSEVTSDSSYYKGLMGNSTFTPGMNNGIFTATPANMGALGQTAVFNVSGSALFQQNAPFNLVASGTINTILINVSGTTLSTAGGENFTGAWGSYQTNVIFNFYEATSITLNTGWQGTILAPNAVVTLNSGASDVNGGIYASSLNITAANEVHNVLYAGGVPALGGPSPTVPLPATVWAGSAMLGAMGAVRAWRRKLARGGMRGS